MSKDLLIQFIPANTSGSPVILSTGESLLLAIAAYKKGNAEKAFLLKLSKLYLEGIKTSDDRTFIKEINEVLTGKNYTISSDAHIINEDPTRRYFETHLAYHLLQNTAAGLDHEPLVELATNIKNRLLALPSKDDSHAKVGRILKGNMKDKHLTKYEKEYAELIAKLTQNDFYGFSAQACKNLLEIAKATSFATLNTQVDSNMPVDVYTDGLFTLGMDGRGRIIKKKNDGVKTGAKGLMKSTSPLPFYEDVATFNKKYYQKAHCSPFLRSADQAVFMTENYWVTYLFSHQVHPYSNGISSTTLAQIRNMIVEKRLGHGYYQGSLQKYLTVFAALMVFNSGGHSFFEIFEVLKMPMCRELIGADKQTLDAIARDELMYKWLSHDQSSAFEKSLEETLKYFQVILAKKTVHAQLQKTPKDEPVKSSNPHGWTALMVASQLGKTEQVKQLIAIDAEVDKSFQGLRALDVAIKWEHYDTVLELVKSGAAIKQSTAMGEELKKRASALYFACRQHDMRILDFILRHEKALNLHDKKESIAVALKIENLPALTVLIKHLDKNERAILFTGKYKLELMQIAAELGSLEVMQFIMALDVFPSVEPLDYQSVINTASAKGFMPLAEWLSSQLRANVSVAKSSMAFFGDAALHEWPKVKANICSSLPAGNSL